ncbi:Retrovirus-related Pol polyprotein from transposon TNT 1-94 [Phytophthora fragariae]|uniref:Retrovirus-related Pol polyprotein from transposon TNT 1-94 n=1 Tax=Phytophthora fragariae TaxID=53985 RepID=A0A6A3RA48_9STRA|nr:Retrovirus-related Pol polyprotein from transposon TNT 1-94 [Phytophthora fragariae]KAE9092520.1 Retrovirus-related Pol polyprotein from transposon TNT 1-94 [Phytophthora fragariae]KAE9193842.1 Retrovirus-related Pol polyprotein from transposon TNT 1-94 [Phytophthora fragariae]KAE9209151.1 Retrovirus-related Pol polyprotein from transposon TNT 1-94 [Phytophthora fragariae]
MLLTLAAIWNYEVDQMDVTTAFLNGPIDGEVYMEQPKGYEEAGKEVWVCMLDKSLYGLKQAPRVWFRLLKDHLEKQGFTIMNCEACVAVKVIDGELVFISIYVDDLILFAPNKKLMKELKQMLHVRFEMKDLGPIHYILGREITRNRKERTIFINQRKYADKVLHRFGMERCNGCKVPSTPDLELSKVMCPTTKEEKDLMSGKPYRAVIGSLMYLMLGTRPDLAYLVRECSQFLENPGILHWRAAKRGLRYLKETQDWGLQFGGVQWSQQKLNDHLKAFADADFANRVDDRKSIAGYLTQFCGSTIFWASQTERTVALHTTEAEYMALSLLVQEVIHLRQMLKELKVKQNNPSDVFVDNESTRKLANNPEFHSRTQHIDVRHHFVRERVELNEITVKRVAGTDNAADAFTKPLPQVKLEQHRATMGLISQGQYMTTKNSCNVDNQ